MTNEIYLHPLPHHIKAPLLGQPVAKLLLDIVSIQTRYR